MGGISREGEERQRQVTTRHRLGSPSRTLLAPATCLCLKLVHISGANEALADGTGKRPWGPGSRKSAGAGTDGPMATARHLAPLQFLV